MRVRLQGLRPDPRTSLQEHAAAAKKLTQIAYSDLSPANSERYTFDAFAQSVNDLSLNHQLLARGVAAVEDALCKGAAYLLAAQLHKSRVGPRQVEAELATANSKAKEAIPEVFIISQLKKDAILGIPFWKRLKCQIDFSQPVVVMDERKLTCVDNFGSPFVGGGHTGSTDRYDT